MREMHFGTLEALALDKGPAPFCCDWVCCKRVNGG